MILSKIVKLEPNAPFLFKGRPATMLWTENVTEDLGLHRNKDGKDERKFSRHLAFCFTCPEVQASPITHRSCWPFPDALELKDYSAA